MRLMELISESERALIVNYIKTYAVDNTTRSDMAPLSHILRLWEKSKSEYLNKIFKDSLILSKPISIEAANRTYLCDKVWENDILKEFIWDFGNKEVSEEEINFKYLARFDEEGGERKFKRILPKYIIGATAFGINVYEGPNFSFTDTITGKEVSVQKGVKITRLINILKNILDIPQERIEEVQIAISQVRNSAKITGDLCLSIHPLDFMTMSDNDYE